MFNNKDKKLYYFAVLLAFISCIFQGFAISKSNDNSLYIKSLWNTTRLSNDIYSLIYREHDENSISGKVYQIKQQISKIHVFLANRPHTNPIRLLENDIIDLEDRYHASRTKDNIVFQLNALKVMLLDDLRRGENISSALYMLAIATLWSSIIVLLSIIFRIRSGHHEVESKDCQSSIPATIPDLPIKDSPTKLEVVSNSSDNNDLSGFLIEDDDDDVAETNYSDIPGMQEIINEFILSIPTRSSSIKQSLKDEDFDTLKREVHTLKGLGGSIGFDELTRIANDIDMLFKSDNLNAGIAKLGELYSELEKIEKSRK